jgi:hypothetical protein
MHQHLPEATEDQTDCGNVLWAVLIEARDLIGSEINDFSEQIEAIAKNPFCVIGDRVSIEDWFVCVIFNNWGFL